MAIQGTKINQKIKPYLIIILSCILSPLLIMNSNYINNQRTKPYTYKEKSKIFDKLIKTRKLRENQKEILSFKVSDKICEKSHEELRDYYKTGDLEIIGEEDNVIKAEDKEKDKAHFKALINIIDFWIKDKDKNETKKLLGLKPIKNDVLTYSKHMIPFLIFLVIGILSIPAWPLYCFCCCCNCCCCCCFKKPKCKLPCFLLSFILYILSTTICILCLIKSNSIIAGIADTKCSILKFYEQIFEGETKEILPKWAGIDEINDILQEINVQIENLRKGSLNHLNQKIYDINTKKLTFKNKMEESGKEFYSTPSGTTYKNLYSSTYSITSRGINGRYVLDLVKIFGKKVTVVGMDEENYLPKNSILDSWHQEYKIISKYADNYLEEAINNLQTITDNSKGDVIESLKQGKENLNKLKNFFNDSKLEFKSIFMDNSDAIDEYGKLIFELIFGIIGLINIALGIIIFFTCFFSGKICKKYCWCRYLFKILPHLLWNILYLQM